MVIELTSEMEAQLELIARHEGKSVAALVFDAAVSLHRDDVAFHEGVERGIAQADAGQFVGEAEMQSRWDRLLRHA